MLVSLVLLCAVPVAQDGGRFHGRLSVLPVDFVTLPTMSGSGKAHATLAGNTLSIEGQFEGLSSPATTAHIHQAPPALRGLVAFTIEVDETTSGEFRGTLVLIDTQIQALQRSEYYVQIHTENNTDGEIRGWLMPQGE